MKIIILMFSLFMPFQESFKTKQLKFTRVKDAYSEKESTVKNYFLQKNLNYQGCRIYIRGFKLEKVLEVWVQQNGSSKFQLLTQYDFCAVSGSLGPKRKEGDGQIPEGFYKINHFNPESNFHLSLGINYPNQSDKLLGDKQRPGSAIYIHGNCVTIGCIPISDDKIKELYILAVEAFNSGQQNIPVHIFPARLTENNFNALLKEHAGNQTVIKFWNELHPVFVDFEKTKKIPEVKINQRGEYYL
jgi:murein L,D-transpeptidase YafK